MFRHVLRDRLGTMGMFGQKMCEKYDVSVGELRSGSRRNVVAQGRGAMSWSDNLLPNTNELPRSRAARYQKEFSFNPDAEHQGILLIKSSFS